MSGNPWDDQVELAGDEDLHEYRPRVRPPARSPQPQRNRVAPPQLPLGAGNPLEVANPLAVNPLEAVFEAMDANDDGVIDRSEFVRGVLRSQPSPVVRDLDGSSADRYGWARAGNCSDEAPAAVKSSQRQPLGSVLNLPRGE